MSRTNWRTPIGAGLSQAAHLRGEYATEVHRLCAPDRDAETDRPRIAAMSLVSVFAILLVVGVAVLGAAALVALVLLLVRGRSVES